MSKRSLQRQAERAENIADQTVDDALKQTLRDAGAEYREEAREKPMYALFRGHTQLAGTFPTKQEVLEAALAEGLVQSETLPAGYSIERVEQSYDPQPGR